MGIHFPQGAVLITIPVQSFDGDGIYIIRWRGKPMVRHVYEGVHGDRDGRLLMVFDGRPADPRPISRTQFAKRVMAKAESVYIALYPPKLAAARARQVAAFNRRCSSFRG
jgi:hypothetical protein